MSEPDPVSASTKFDQFGPWYTFQLGRGGDSVEHLKVFQNRILKTVGGIGVRAPGVAVLNDARSGMTVWVSPEAAKLIMPLLKEYAAQPCQKPRRRALTALVVGDASVLKSLEYE